MFKALKIAYFHTYFWTTFKSPILKTNYVLGISLHNEGKHFIFPPKNMFFLGVKVQIYL
jgi:hypothetical protein